MLMTQDAEARFPTSKAKLKAPQSAVRVAETGWEVETRRPGTDAKWEAKTRRPVIWGWEAETKESGERLRPGGRPKPGRRCLVNFAVFGSSWYSLLRSFPLTQIYKEWESVFTEYVTPHAAPQFGSPHGNLYLGLVSQEGIGLRLRPLDWFTQMTRVTVTFTEMVLWHKRRVP